MLEKVKRTPYLDCNTLDFGSKNKAIAYLTSARVGTSVNDKGFLRFWLRDVNKNQVPGIMFEVPSYTVARDLAALRRTPVSVEFYPDEYRGSLSLKIESIENYNGEYDHSLFMGSIPHSNEILVKLNETVEKLTGKSGAFRQGLATQSYSMLCNDLAGGFVKFSQLVLNGILAYRDTPGVEIKDLMIVAYKTLNTYSIHLERLEKIDLELKHESLVLITEETQDLQDFRLRNICLDALSAVMGLGSPQHLYAHMVVDTMKTVEKLLSYSYSYPLVIEGTHKIVGDEILARY